MSPSDRPEPVGLPTWAAAESGPPETLAGAGAGSRLWLIRHAEVHEDWHGVAYGQLDVPLSEEGRRASRKLAAAVAALEPDHLLSSDLQRARVVAQSAARILGRESELVPELREVDRGTWQGRKGDEVRTTAPKDVEAFYADPWRWRGHGGESDELLFARARTPIERALQSSAPVTIVACTHYNVIRVLVGRALGIAPARTFGVRVDPGRCVLLEDAASGWVLRHSNVATPRSGDEDVLDPTHPAHAAQPELQHDASAGRDRPGGRE